MMNKNEVGELLAMCSALDGQQVTESKALMWLEVLDGVSYEEAKAALIPAYKDSANEIVTAKGVWEQVRRARSQPASSDRMLEEADWKSDPQPICEAHNLRILECLDCCSLIFAQADYMSIDDRHSWAMANAYKPKEAWL